ncbi:MAG TPA: hypothetical protein VK587_12595 [bacterium]|nr:hypothetical protein [bacterium]
MSPMKNLFAAGALLAMTALVFGAPISAFAQAPHGGDAMLISQVQTELKTATFHSGELAQKVNALAGVQLHLHHVINCLEGPNGPDYLASVGYPCQGQGNGIIPDLKVAVMHMVPGSSAALQEAETCQMLALQAVASKDINEAQPFALVISRHLQTASQYLSQ